MKAVLSILNSCININVYLLLGTCSSDFVTEIHQKTSAKQVTGQPFFATD